ncbi:MAG: hypothetical protein RL190_492 [Actinomycetota bacterium]|jgi:roadblock/LC7 domain-containing protein
MRRPLAILACLAGLAAAPATAPATVVYATDWTRLGTATDAGRAMTPLGVRGWGAEISPDGRLVAYLRGPVGDATGLVIRDLATGARVTAAAADGQYASVRGLEWAPDSTALLVETQTADAEGFVTGEGLAVVDARTGAPTVIVPARGSQTNGYGWSPDAQRIAYNRQAYAGRLYGGTLYVAARDGTGAVSLGRGSDPLWGPALIAVRRYTSERWQGTRVWHSQIWTVDPAQGAASARQLTRFRASHGMVMGPWVGWWTPDGRTLVGGVGGEDYTEPARIDVATGRLRYVRMGGERQYEAVVTGLSADGATLLVQRDVISGAPTYWILPLAGGTGKRLLRGATSVSVPATWAP